MRRISGLAALAGLMILTAPAKADGPKKTAQRTLAAVNAAQELSPLTPEQMEQRKGEIDDSDALAADVALNDWKLCVTDAVARWAPLRAGPGTVADGAFGRCGDIARRYRDSLARMTQDGRPVMDLQMARAMARSLEDLWRPKIVATVLDQELAGVAAKP